MFALVLLLAACSNDAKESDPEIQPKANQSIGFSQLPPSQTGLDFNNTIVEKEEMNYFIHSGFYNGAGMAAGDLNNDGLIDLFFSGNQVQNEIYLNRTESTSEGNELKFEKITANSGLDQDRGWCSGATMVDINGDGWLDIYVCRYFSPDGKQSTANLLYINNHDLTFTESAAEYGIADAGNSVQATFLDYDQDGDLDLYVVNQPSGFREEKRNLVAPNGWKDTDRLYRNEGNGHFEEVTEEAGILNFGYGLSAVAADINNDGYPDIFVANDYEAPDFLYFNDKTGGFRRIENHVFKHVSNYSMGADIADFNNDGWLDIFVADMLAEDHYRQKANMGAMNEKAFNDLVAAGMHYQYMRNMLHLNNKFGGFSEIGQLAGVSQTDWSWAPLFADFDNDGHQDLFVTNGILRDVRNNDAQRSEVENKLAFTQSFPSHPISNAMFRNSGKLQFEKIGHQWGITDPGFSNGAVYADLDNDGDLDLVTNNVNAPASLYQNNSSESGNWLQIELKGNAGNPRGRGAKVTVFRKNDQLYQENTIERGYMSAVSGILHFGLGEEEIEKVQVVWPGRKRQTILQPKVNQRLVVRQADAGEDWTPSRDPSPVFVPREEALNIDWKHEENEYNDFEKQVLLPHKMSLFGPGIAVGDVNGDGADDFYVGGAADQAGALFVKRAEGGFARNTVPVFEADRSFEDMGVLFLDIDGDGDEDLYVVSGGNCFAENSAKLLDRIYLNDGKGNFNRDTKRLPDFRSSGSCVVAADYDRDGDLDLFVGGRHRPGNYPLTPKSYLLENENGYFKDVTAQKAPGLQEIGMVSAALWSDFDNDGQVDLMVVGEWMPVTIFKNDEGKLKHFDQDSSLLAHTGWWNSIVGGDFDRDGDIDYIVGNQGLNTKFRVSEESPLELYSHDFDGQNGPDIVLASRDHGQTYPIRGRECSSQQVPQIQEQFENYHSFASATLEDIYTPEKLKQAEHFQATTFASSMLRNNQGAGFEVIPLPIEAQFSSVFGMVAHDFDLDGKLDLLLTGNFYAPEVETGRQDAGIGVLLKGDGEGRFTPLDALETGFISPGDARSLAMLYDGAFPLLLIGNNDDQLQAYSYIHGTGKGGRFQTGEIYAEMHFKDGSVQRVEQYRGSGYLSGSTGFVQIGPETEKLVFHRADGREREVR